MRAGVQTPASTEKVRYASWLHATPAEGTETGTLEQAGQLDLLK